MGGQEEERRKTHSKHRIRTKDIPTIEGGRRLRARDTNASRHGCMRSNLAR